MIDEDNYPTFKDKILASMKSGKYSHHSLINSQGEYCNSWLFNLGHSSTIGDNHTSFDVLIQPIYYKGRKAWLVSMQNTQEKRVKQSLLINQSIEITALLIDIITILEKELRDVDDNASDSEQEENIVFKKNLLKLSSKWFNEFLYVKNVFEIESHDLRKEEETFSLKEYFLYSIDLLLSLKQKSKIKITIDPMIPSEVRGDLIKFRQIITTVLDFSFKSTGDITIKLTSEFDRTTGGLIIYFLIVFTPKFEINEKELLLLFGDKEDLFINQTKLTKLVGLSVHVLPELVKFLGGKFWQLKHTSENQIIIEFTIPFSPTSTPQNSITKTPDITMNLRRRDKKGMQI